LSEDFVSRAPWSLQPSLKQMAEEVGVDFDKFIEGLKHNKSDQEISKEFGVSDKVIRNLRNHFEQYGVHSIVGQD
jgi:DNA-directed RNA polymerase specialized sigma subunit